MGFDFPEIQKISQHFLAQIKLCQIKSAWCLEPGVYNVQAEQCLLCDRRYL